MYTRSHTCSGHNYITNDERGVIWKKRERMKKETDDKRQVNSDENDCEREIYLYICENRIFLIV